MQNSNYKSVTSSRTLTTIIGSKMRLAKISKYPLGDDVYQISLSEIQYARIIKSDGKWLVQDGIGYKIQSIVPFMLTLTKVV